MHDQAVRGKMTSADITFLVFTSNEERRVEPMLQCLQGHGSIIVVDNFSTDNTLSIARKYAAEIYLHKNIGYVENEETIRFATSKATTNWVYLAYVDELIPRQLMDLIKGVSAGNKYDAAEIYRKNFMYGREVFNYGKHHLRLFKKDAVDFSGNIVHRLGKYRIPRSRVLKVSRGPTTCIWHFSAYNSDKLELVHNRYANLEARQRVEMLRQGFSGTRAIFKLIFYFFGTYIGLGGFRGGWPGLFLSVQIAYYKFSIESRLWELEHGISVSTMEEQYAVLKERLLSEYR